jgi:hypothetical protein
MAPKTIDRMETAQAILPKRELLGQPATKGHVGLAPKAIFPALQAMR